MAVVGGGVVGAAVLYWLARRGVGALLLEAEDGLALQASGTNSGILHTGFDSTPGELETQLLLRSAELRPAVLEELGIPVLRCGAILEPHAPKHRRFDPAVLKNLAVKEQGTPEELLEEAVQRAGLTPNTAVICANPFRENERVDSGRRRDHRRDGGRRRHPLRGRRQRRWASRGRARGARGRRGDRHLPAQGRVLRVRSACPAA